MHLGIAPYVCLVLLCLQCTEGSWFCFCSYENLGGSTVFLWSLGPGSILSHGEYVYSVNGTPGLSVIAWSPGLVIWILSPPKHITFHLFSQSGAHVLMCHFSCPLTQPLRSLPECHPYRLSISLPTRAYCHVRTWRFHYM